MSPRMTVPSKETGNTQETSEEILAYVSENFVVIPSQIWINFEICSMNFREVYLPAAIDLLLIGSEIFQTVHCGEVLSIFWDSTEKIKEKFLRVISGTSQRNSYGRLVWRNVRK